MDRNWGRKKQTEAETDLGIDKQKRHRESNRDGGQRQRELTRDRICREKRHKESFEDRDVER